MKYTHNFSFELESWNLFLNDFIRFKSQPLLWCLLMLIIATANSNFIVSKAVLILTFIFVTLALPIFQNKISIYNKKIKNSGLILIIFNVLILMFKFYNLNSLYNGLLFCASILFVIVLSNVITTNINLEIFIKIMAIVTKILLLIYFIALKLHVQVPWISSTSILFCFLYFIFIDNKTKHISKILFSVLWLNIALMNGERTQVLVSMLGLIIYLFINKLKNHKKIYALFFIVVSSLLVLIPIIYTLLSLSEYRWRLDFMAIQFTGSRFFSGRDTVWAVLLNNYVENDIYFGAGHHLTPKLISSIDYSAHNTYIIILVRTGLIGLILFFNFLKQIWMSYFKNLNNQYTRLSATYFLTILLKQSSEMGLIGNNMALSVISWIIICFGFFYTNSDSYLK